MAKVVGGTTVKIKEGMFNDPIEFFNAVIVSIEPMLADPIERYAKETTALAKQKILSGSVPGTFSENWKAQKAKLGLRTEPFQRLGPGNSRSYYDNITWKRAGRGKGRLWFVGLPRGKAAYNVGKAKNGKLKIRRDKDRALWDTVAEMEDAL